MATVRRKATVKVPETSTEKHYLEALAGHCMTGNHQPACPGLLKIAGQDRWCKCDCHKP